MKIKVFASGCLRSFTAWGVASVYRLAISLEHECIKEWEKVCLSTVESKKKRRSWLKWDMRNTCAFVQYQWALRAKQWPGNQREVPNLLSWIENYEPKDVIQFEKHLHVVSFCTEHCFFFTECPCTLHFPNPYHDKWYKNVDRNSGNAGLLISLEAHQETARRLWELWAKRKWIVVVLIK